MTRPGEGDSAPDSAGRAEPVEGEDFYREGPYVVFTARYLSARGYCCESGCRHCPWGYRSDERRDVPTG